MAKTIWKGTDPNSKPHVVQEDDGGLRFRYLPHLHVSTAGFCNFSLFCEVGQLYKLDFDGFFKTHKLSKKALELNHRPWLADQLES